jgi:hypothetical protein
VMEKLCLTEREFNDILDAQPRTFMDYPNYFHLIKKNKKIIQKIYRLVSHSTPPILYELE